MPLTRKIALIQFDAVPEERSANLAHMQRLSRASAAAGARWIMFHESTLTDYTPRLSELAEPVPSGGATTAMADLAKQHDCYISFGLSEVENERYYISQVFVGPSGYFYHYRKTWICRKETDEGYRNEWKRYDPGAGPELFDVDGVNATCFICSDGVARRCIERAAALRPQIVFFPHNVRGGVEPANMAERAMTINAPILLTNRVGHAWTHGSPGGTAVISARGEVVAQANMEGKEEILLHELEIPDERTSQP
ncbi:MAG: hypothetical protein CMJ18_02970 [Phycisphaeraceae bacterium]|nr:hypothetical protein [Phycisphaeraceae bacterium]